jgi:hypothetical protein
MRCHHPTKRTRPLLRLVVHVMADGKAVNDTADRTRTAEKSLPPEFALDMPPQSRCHCVPSLGGGDCEWSLMRDSHRDGEMSWNDSWVILVAGMGLGLNFAHTRTRHEKLPFPPAAVTTTSLFSTTTIPTLLHPWYQSRCQASIRMQLICT